METWRSIPGYEGKYEVSDLGRVKSLPRKVRSVNHYTGKEFMRIVPERILRHGRYTKSGHVSVVLGHGEVGKPVHQLVALAFLGECPEGMEILHNDGNPANNTVANLRYGSRSANILDVYYQGKRWRKLTINDVREIREMLNCGYSGREISELFNVSEQSISAIRTGRTFSWLEE